VALEEAEGLADRWEKKLGNQRLYEPNIEVSEQDGNEETSIQKLAPLTQNATLAMMLQTNCSDIHGGFDIDRTTGTELNATSCEIANQIRRSLALGNSLLSTHNLADAGSTIASRQTQNPVGKARSFSAYIHRPGNVSQVVRPAFDPIVKRFGYGNEDRFPLANNYSTIIPKKQNFGMNLHEST